MAETEHYYSSDQYLNSHKVLFDLVLLWGRNNWTISVSGFDFSELTSFSFLPVFFHSSTINDKHDIIYSHGGLSNVCGQNYLSHAFFWLPKNHK